MQRDVESFYNHKYTNTAEISRSSKQFAIDCVPNGGGLRILDVGCGTGLNSAALAAKGHTVCGVDISSAAIEQYCGRGFEGQIVNLEGGIDYPDGSFDLVFCSEVIEHMTMPEVLTFEMERLLKNGGHLVISTPNSAFWVYRLLGLLGYTVSELQHQKHFQFFSRRSLSRLLTAGQLRIKERFGRNMYLILPDPPRPVGILFAALGLKVETRFRTGKKFWHLSSKSSFLNSIFADTLILVLEKSGACNSHHGSLPVKRSRIVM